MNTFKGPFRVIFEDLRIQFYILTGATLVLSLVYLIIGKILASHDTFTVGASFGPYYSLFLYYPFLAYTKAYKYTISLGGTRKQFLLSTIANTGIFLLMTTLILNAFYLLTDYLANKEIISAKLIHMGDLVKGASPLLYPWIDLLWGIILFGIGLFLCSCWYYFGTVRTMIAATILLILAISYIAFGEISPFIQFMISKHLTFVHILAGISCLLIFLSYFIMRNGPLERCTKLNLSIKS
ncbi:hypothetical protein [Cytobacillus massiliigabonensis]|uniref:hypothetical protein n=1 Tax=Cytobacillus massiliigabonensis TaxID=1871011 RepID=UPI000C84B3F0|nr:hypothetical protein [Cytobacillus massiliigabonensis]